MNYDIPALDAMIKAEKKLLDELSVFRLKMNTVEMQMNKALRVMETAQKKFEDLDADQEAFDGIELPVYLLDYN